MPWLGGYGDRLTVDQYLNKGSRAGTSTQKGHMYREDCLHPFPGAELQTSVIGRVSTNEPMLTK